jgi:hypothetical protein
VSELLLEVGGVNIISKMLARIKWRDDHAIVECDPIDCREERMVENIFRGS